MRLKHNMQILGPKNVVWKVIGLGIDALYCCVVKSISIFVANKLILCGCHDYSDYYHLASFIMGATK